ncbi:MAG: phosphodiester glycosidase family protein [Thermoleophilia bacterium]|nr:phosphodiester glycosidase family protein [Thermoleophilia bacterium]
MKTRQPSRSLTIGLVALIAMLGVCGASPAAVPIGPGAVYEASYRSGGPWAIHTVEADLDNEYLEVKALLGGGEGMARKQLPKMFATAETEIVRPVAAVNGDFFSLAGGSYDGIPLGLHVTDGELLTLPEPSRSVLYVREDGSVQIDRLRPNVWLRGPKELLFPVAGLNRPPGYADLVMFTPHFGEETRAQDDSLQIALVAMTGPMRSHGTVSGKIANIATGAHQRIPPGGAVLVARGVAAYALRKLVVGDEVTIIVQLESEEELIGEAIGGGPRLVRDGRVSVEYSRERFSGSFASRRHPRTGVGLRDNTLVLVTVDGRQPGYSEGMTLEEFAHLFVELGCTDALNLDGGGSTTMVVRGETVNAPSGGVERAVVNGLAVVSAAPLGPPVQLAIRPSELTVLGGETVFLRPVGIDEYYNRVELNGDEVEWTLPPGFGTVSETGVFTADTVRQPTASLVTARYGELQASAVVRIAPLPTKIVVTPDTAQLDPGSAQKFTALALDAGNQPIELSRGRLRWRVEPPGTGGWVDESGLFKAPEAAGELAIVACVGDVCGRAEVVVGGELGVVEDFEADRSWAYRAEPAEAPGGVVRVEDRLRPGNHCLRLTYDFTEGEGTRTAHAELNLPLPESRMFSVSVLGDGQAAWLRARLRDAAGRAVTVDLAPRVNWIGSWRRVTALLPAEAEQPLVLESIYLAEYHEDQQPAGAIFLDDISAGPVVEAKEAASPAAPPLGGANEMSDLPDYVVGKTNEDITIDGHLNEGVWARARSLGDFIFADASGEPQLPTEVKMCWDERNLYLAFVAIDTDIWGTMKDRDDPIYEEEAVETFLSTGGEVTKYFEFEFSPHNVVFDALIECPESGDRSKMTVDTSWDCEGLQSAVSVVGSLDDRTDVDDRWTVEVALPFAQIGREGRPPAGGEQWRANFYRIDQAGGGEYSCWSPTLVQPPSFHVPKQFGVLTFSDDMI